MCTDRGPFSFWLEIILWALSRISTLKWSHLSIFYFQCNIFTRAMLHHPTRANVNKLVHSCMSLGLHSIRQVMYCTTHLCMPFTCNGKWGHIRMLHRKGIFTFVVNNFVGSMYWRVTDVNASVVFAFPWCKFIVWSSVFPRSDTNTVN